jgi:hypothetical protein
MSLHGQGRRTLAFEAEVRAKRQAAETARVIAHWISDHSARKQILRRAADLDAVAKSLQGRHEAETDPGN